MISPALLPWVAFLLPFLASWASTRVLIRLAPRLRLVDLPNERKVHTVPTPRGGGLAICLGVGVTACLIHSSLSASVGVALGLGFVIAILGLADDLRPLPWQLRLGIQTVAAIAAIVYGLPAELAWPWRLAALFWIVGLVNAFNMLDNMDALSAGVAWIAAAALAVHVGLMTGTLQSALPWLMLMGALAGFLWFNRPPARIFMGDVGSTFLGFFLGLRSIETVTGDQPVLQSWAVPLCILAVAWYDLCSVVSLRLWQGKSPFHADKQHLSHRLVSLGLNSRRAVLVIYLMGVACGLLGLGLVYASDLGKLLLTVQLIFTWLAVAGIEFFQHFRKEFRRRE